MASKRPKSVVPNEDTSPAPPKKVVEEVDGEDEGIAVPENDDGKPLPANDVADQHGKIHATRHCDTATPPQQT